MLLLFMEMVLLVLNSFLATACHVEAFWDKEIEVQDLGSGLHDQIFRESLSNQVDSLPLILNCARVDHLFWRFYAVVSEHKPNLHDHS